ncbi:MAG: NADH oxidoreductase (quinone) subunit F [Acidobacteria bacterium]|nr:MAG: NADH oxidoreductase (quinone) subunit F [Acidobacteriota bacterium]
MSTQAHPLETRVVSRRFDQADAYTLQGYLASDGFKALDKAFAMQPEAIIEEVKKSGLRGRGGAGFPTGMKWSFVPKQSPREKYVLCNADESEPGTCKDRLILEYDPFSIIEGMLIAGLAIGARRGYIYIRGEYRYLLDRMEKALEEARAAGYVGKNIRGRGFDFDIYAHTGAGAYECGEESALMESLEGKRGIPRLKPPFPAVSGYLGGPTVINNVETLASVPHILLHGGEWFAAFGPPKNGGTRLFCLSGHVNQQGVWELPLGFPLRRLIEELGGGMRNGAKLKAVVPGGSSTPLLPADVAWNVNLDFDSMAKVGTFLGSGGVVVLDETTCMVKFALRIMQFYRHESCGWCVPCREGTNWLQTSLTRFHNGGGREADIALMQEVSQNILGHTFCALGDAAAMPTISILQHWRQEFVDHLAGKPCPFGAKTAVAVGAH